nr:hypothetical protein MACL_00002253 [Theileria orientalis]
MTWYVYLLDRIFMVMRLVYGVWYYNCFCHC